MVKLIQLIFFTILSAYSFLLYATDTLLPIKQNFSLQEMKNKCVDLIPYDNDKLIKECRVSEFGQIGSANNHNFYYAIYCLVSNYDEKVTCQSKEASRYYGNRGLVIFSAQESVDKVEILAIRLQDYNGSLVSYSKPQLIENQNRKLLYIPVPMDGTGNFNLSEYYLWNSKSNQWGKLETESWIKKLVMPNKDVSPRKGIWVDLETMTSKIYLYKQGDGNCCPTGGLLTVRLSITDNHFSVVSTEYDKNQK